MLPFACFFRPRISICRHTGCGFRVTHAVCHLFGYRSFLAIHIGGPWDFAILLFKKGGDVYSHWLGSEFLLIGVVFGPCGSLVLSS